MATQAEVDAITNQVNIVASDLEQAKNNLQSEIDGLAQQGSGVDVSALQAAVAPLDDAVQALNQIQPSQPAPTDTPPTTP